MSVILVPSRHPLSPFWEREVRQRVPAGLPQIAEGTDIRAMSDRLLREFWLPSRPTTPRLRGQWEEMFTPSPDGPTAFVNRAELELVPASHGGALAQAAGRWGTSRNWSGAVIAARDAKRFCRVVGTWTVPKATQPDDHVAAKLPPGKAYQVSVWVGLDGFRLASRSLPQLGTVSAWNPATGQPEYYLWVQWWVRNKMYRECKVRNFKVEEGDEIHATAEVAAARDDVLFSIVSKRPGRANRMLRLRWLAGSYDAAAGVTVELPNDEHRQRGKAPSEGWHAVWCVERPAVMPDGATPDSQVDPRDIESFRLPGFEGAVLRDALAEMRDLADDPASAEERDLTGARLLRMIETVSGDRTHGLRLLTSPQWPPSPGRRQQVDWLRDGRLITPVA
jgi:hypothetical protein